MPDKASRNDSAAFTAINLDLNMCLNVSTTSSASPARIIPVSMNMHVS